LADNVSSGIEPVFAFSYVRHVLQPDGSKREESVEDHAFRHWRALKGNEPPSDAFVDAQTLTPADHLTMQAAAQDFVDSSISKTINLPQDYRSKPSKGSMRRPMRSAARLHDLSAKRGDGCGARSEAIRAESRSGAGPAAREKRRGLHRPAARPARGTAGPDLQDQMAGSDHAIYITINDVMQEAAAGRSRSSSTPRTWSTTPGRCPDPHDLGGVPRGATSPSWSRS